jgi:hypothetical protein
MNWVFQVLVVLIAFGPLIVGTLIWHFVWNNKSGPPGDPPPGGGQQRRPVPPPPRFCGDRQARSRTPVYPAPVPSRSRAG